MEQFDFFAASMQETTPDFVKNASFGPEIPNIMDDEEYFDNSRAERQNEIITKKDLEEIDPSIKQVENQYSQVKKSIEPNLEQDFDIPTWGIIDFIRERATWQKGIESLTGEPGWFYFKIFFKFNTAFGLFGDILNRVKNAKSKENNAFNYLNSYCKQQYRVDQIYEKTLALLRFVGSLSYINENAPWFFNSITGLNNALSVRLNEPFKNNEIEIGVREDAVDMRLTTLFELYKYACFDNINLKEVIPENLRKFDMTIMIFHTPLRYYHTGFQSMKDGTYEYKSFANSMSYDNSDKMSFLMFTFSNCEFDIESINSVTMPSEISNETAFNLGKSSFKIKYNRVYRHTNNEWAKIFFGDGASFIDGVNANKDRYDYQRGRINAMKTAVDNSKYYNKTADIYKPLVDAVEKDANDIMRAIDPEVALGNIYWNNTFGQNRLEQLRNQQSSLDNTNLSLKSLKGYVVNKVKNTISDVKSVYNSIVHGGKDTSMGIGSNYFKAQLDLLKYGDDDLHGYNPYAPGTPYFKERVKKEKQGDSSLH